MGSSSSSSSAMNTILAVLMISSLSYLWFFQMPLSMRLIQLEEEKQHILELHREWEKQTRMNTRRSQKRATLTATPRKPSLEPNIDLQSSFPEEPKASSNGVLPVVDQQQRHQIIRIEGHSRKDRNVPSMSWLQEYCFAGRLCQYLNISSASSSPNHYHHTEIQLHFHCRDLFTAPGVGSGNYMATMYAVRAWIQEQPPGTATLRIQCPDAYDERAHLLFPWLTGNFTSHQDNNIPTTTTTTSICRNENSKPRNSLYQVKKEIQYDMRRMALTLLRPTDDQHPAIQWARQHLWASPNSPFNEEDTNRQHSLPSPLPDDQEPLFPEEHIDDAVFHFRCGDLVVIKSKKYGFLKFSSYLKPLLKDGKNGTTVQSIGIVTQPFSHSETSRKKDSQGNTKCRMLVTAFVEYLQAHLPHATISVHNHPTKETVALTYSRMILARRYLVVGVSSFGLFPAIATFAQAHVMPQLHLNPQFYEAAAADSTSSGEGEIEQVGEIHVMEREPFLTTDNQHDLWEQKNPRTGDPMILEWFRNESMSPLSWTFKNK